MVMAEVARRKKVNPSKINKKLLLLVRKVFLRVSELLCRDCGCEDSGLAGGDACGLIVLL